MRSALRRLARDRVFAAWIVLLISLGLGLLSTMFALLDAVRLRDLDVPDAGSLFQVVALKDGRKDAAIDVARVRSGVGADGCSRAGAPGRATRAGFTPALRRGVNPTVS